jgi:hypothetical protein
VRPARKVDKLTAVCEPLVYRKCGSLDVPQPYGPSWFVIGIHFIFLLISTLIFLFVCYLFNAAINHR